MIKKFFLTLFFLVLLIHDQSTVQAAEFTCKWDAGGCTNNEATNPCPNKTDKVPNLYCRIFTEEDVCDFYTTTKIDCDPYINPPEHPKNSGSSTTNGGATSNGTIFTPTVCKTINTSGGNNTNIEGVDSAIGCIPTSSLDEFVNFILKFVFGIAGGVIVLTIIKLGYDILTSSGDSNKINAVKERLISLFSGLVMIVFSLVLLKTIGVDILGLPGF